jgi:hypothetical protein
MSSEEQDELKKLQDSINMINGKLQKMDEILKKIPITLEKDKKSQPIVLVLGILMGVTGNFAVSYLVEGLHPFVSPIVWLGSAIFAYAGLFALLLLFYKFITQKKP